MKENILDVYEKVSIKYGYNSNSLHKLGFDARKLEKAASEQILNVLNLSDYDVIYTSGNAESYTMIAKGVKGSIFSFDKYFLEVCNKLNVSISEEPSAHYKHINLELDGIYYNLSDYDFITIEDDIPFFGVLLKKKSIDMESLIHGGKSTTKYRSGTSVTPLIVSFAKLVKLKYRK